jgi:tetratricopeptide (TPR) repeat protein
MCYKNTIPLLIALLFFCTKEKYSIKTANEYLALAKIEESSFLKKELLDSVMAIDSNIIDAYIEKGNIYRNDGPVDSAIHMYSIVINKEPLNADLLAYRGLAYVLAGDKNAAMADIQSSIKIDSLNVHGYYALAMFKMDLENDNKDAADLFCKAIKMDTTINEIYFNMAYNLHEMGMIDSAYMILKSIIGRKKIQTAYWSNLAMFSSQLGKYDEAIEYFRTALEKDSLGYQNYINRALTYLELYDTISAVLDFNRFLKFAPYKNERKPAIREKIIELGGKPEY